MPGSPVFNNGENGFSVLDRLPFELLNGQRGVHRLMHVYAHTCNYVNAALLSSPSSAMTGTTRRDRAPASTTRGRLSHSYAIGDRRLVSSLTAGRRRTRLPQCAYRSSRFQSGIQMPRYLY